MNETTSRSDVLDRRLRRLCRTLDAQPGFEARLAARLARERPAPDAAALVGARARALRERRAAEAALQRGLRTNLLLVAAATLAAIGPAWLCGRILGHALGALPGAGSLWLAAASATLFVGWLWALLARTGRGESAALLLA
jgi:hypothetical protein